MDDRDANIDILFRNGFKNLEVLPPAEVWENIKPVLSKHEKSVILFRRLAAGVALLVSAGLLIQELSREASVVALNSLIPSGQEQVPPVEAIPEINTSQVIETNPVPQGLLIAKNENTTIPDISGRENVLISKITYLPAETNFNEFENTLKVKSPAREKINVSSADLYIDDPYKDILHESKPAKPADRWSVAALASPTYFSQFRFGRDQAALQMMASEQPLVSYSGGLALGYKINKRISVQSGVFYSSVGQEIKGISSFGGFTRYDNTKGSRNFEVMTSIGMVYTDNSDVFLVDETAGRITQFTNEFFDPLKADLDYLNNSLKQNYSYIELPVFVRYKIIDKTLDVNLIGGLSYNFLVNNSVYAMSGADKYPIGKTDGLSIMSFNSSLGMGMEYSFARNISFNLEPTFRYYLNPFRSMEGSGIHPYSFGVFSGFSFRF